MSLLLLFLLIFLAGVIAIAAVAAKEITANWVNLDNGTAIGLSTFDLLLRLEIEPLVLRKQKVMCFTAFCSI
jgi:hypothetical protein